MADVNGLKLTNDAFGHAAGDQLLELLQVLLADIRRDVDERGEHGSRAVLEERGEDASA